MSVTDTGETIGDSRWPTWLTPEDRAGGCLALVLQVALRLNNGMSNKSFSNRFMDTTSSLGFGIEGISNVGQARGDQTQTGSATEHSQQHTSDSETEGSELDDENAFA